MRVASNIERQVPQASCSQAGGSCLYPIRGVRFVLVHHRSNHELIVPLLAFATVSEHACRLNDGSAVGSVGLLCLELYHHPPEDAVGPIFRAIA